MPHEIVPTEKELRQLVGDSLDLPPTTSPRWEAVYAPQLQGEEVFRMVNWSDIEILAQQLHPQVKNYIMRALEAIPLDDEVQLIQARNDATQQVIWQVYGSKCRSLTSVDKHGNPTQPSPLGFPLAVQFGRKTW